MAQEKQPLYLVGLNVMRLFAVVLMFITHSFRIQDNFKTVYSQQGAESFFDHMLIFFMQIEPLTSVLFLFIAGVSLVLAKHKQTETKGEKYQGGEWFVSLLPRLLSLYLIAVVLFIFGHSWQFPALLITPGILSTIAISLIMTALLLISVKPNIALSFGVCVISLIAFGLDERGVSIAGVNSGPGCVLPLAAFCLLGALAANMYLSKGVRGLLVIALVMLPISIGTILIDYPWTVVHKLTFLHFSNDPVQNVLLALQHIFGLSDIKPLAYTPGFWNQSAIFLPRTMALLFVMLAIFIACFSVSRPTSSTPYFLRFFDFLGRHALYLYVFHLIILALLSLSGIKPTSSEQTVLLVLMLLMAGAVSLYGTQRWKMTLSNSLK